jgi:hypothetical protein
VVTLREWLDVGLQQSPDLVCGHAVDHITPQAGALAGNAATLRYTLQYPRTTVQDTEVDPNDVRGKPTSGIGMRLTTSHLKLEPLQDTLPH